jgi:hypothetical protein
MCVRNRKICEIEDGHYYKNLFSEDPISRRDK